VGILAAGKKSSYHRLRCGKMPGFVPQPDFRANKKPSEKTFLKNFVVIFFCLTHAKGQPPLQAVG